MLIRRFRRLNCVIFLLLLVLAGSILYMKSPETISEYIPSLAITDRGQPSVIVDEYLDTEMAARKANVEKICAMMKASNTTPLNSAVFEKEYWKHLMVIENTQTVYCYLPKVASTNFRRVVLGLLGVVPKSEISNVNGYDVYNLHNKKFKYITEFPESKQIEIMRTYKKFLAVRDPMERLLSGYMSKFLHPNPINRAEFNKRVSLFYAIHEELDKQHQIKIDYDNRSVFFAEFLVWWSDLYDEELYVNEHFVPSYVLCNPCEVKYDYIGKYEHINRDMDYIFQHLNLDAEFPGRNDNYSVRRTNTMVDTVYKPLPGWLLQKTWNVLKYDFLMFDYPVPDWFKANIHTDDVP